MDCVFCDLLSGTAPGHFIARRPAASAFLPRSEGSIAPLHSLVVPNRHCTDLLDATEPDLQATMSLVREMARAMVEVLGAGGVNLLSASGPHSEQSVPHLHVHVVPRWAGDGFTTWPTGRSSRQLPEQAVEELAKRLDLGTANQA